MRKLIRKCQNGVDTSSIPNTLNIGAESLNIGKGLSQSALDAANAWKSVGQGGFLSGVSNFGKDIFKNMGGTSGLISMGGNIVNSLLPEATQSKGLKFANNILSFAENIPVYGKFATLAKLGINTLNTAAGHTIKSLNNDQEVQDTLAGTGGGYGDFMNSWDEASKYSGKRAGFFDGNKYDRMVEDANRQMNVLQNIIGRKRTDDLLTAQMADRWNERTMMDMNGGSGNISFGRLGLKVEILPKVHAILNKPKVLDTLKEWEEEVPEFKEGGKMNVIPEGSLHARLHHMENADSLTKKGIPVVSIAEGGELEQQAEIELNEIIFNLEVTTELEKLMKDGSDSAAIEAGKLLVKEIFENTDDRTGLIKQLEPEKKEPTAEDIVKYHQVFQGGGILPTFKDKGILEKINGLSPEQLEKLIKFLNEV